MNELLTAIFTGATASIVTNLDNFAVLLLLFSRMNGLFQRRHIVVGQYLGFAVLIGVSLFGFFGCFSLPHPWTGLLGLVPIALGVHRLLHQEPNDLLVEEDESSLSITPALTGFLSPQTYGVAAMTLATGGDNVGLYMPLFATVSWQNLVLIASVVLLLVGVWCYVAHRLAQVPAIAHAWNSYSNQLAPFALVGVGGLILTNSHILDYHDSAIATLAISGFYLVSLGQQLANKASDSVQEAEKH